MAEFGLYHSNKDCIAERKWLTDDEITATQKLINNAYPHIGDLQPTILGETLAFAVEKGEFVQILNVKQMPLDYNINNWLSQGAGDSLPCVDVLPQTKEQIAVICFTDRKSITVNICGVQEQRGSSDCGLFALAFTVSLCDGENFS